MTGEAIKDGILCGMYTEYTHPNIAAGCLAYEVELEGVLGVVRLSPFNPDEHYVKLIDPKGVGKVSAEVDPTSMNLVGDLETTYYTVIILGPKDDGSGGFTLWTFHPGDPVRASEVPAEGNVGKTITIREAKKMGLTHAKVKQN
jgi:hypothetical protein